MARPKNPDIKTKEEQIRERMEEQFQEQQEKKQSLIVEDVDAREAFRQYWALNKQSFKQSNDVEEIVWAHLKSTGHDQPDKFEQGVVHFGFKK